MAGTRRAGLAHGPRRKPQGSPRSTDPANPTIAGPIEYTFGTHEAQTLEGNQRAWFNHACRALFVDAAASIPRPTGYLAAQEIVDQAQPRFSHQQLTSVAAQITRPFVFELAPEQLDQSSPWFAHQQLLTPAAARQTLPHAWLVEQEAIEQPQPTRARAFFAPAAPTAPALRPHVFVAPEESTEQPQPRFAHQAPPSSTNVRSGIWEMAYDEEPHFADAGFYKSLSNSAITVPPIVQPKLQPTETTWGTHELETLQAGQEIWRTTANAALLTSLLQSPPFKSWLAQPQESTEQQQPTFARQFFSPAVVQAPSFRTWQISPQQSTEPDGNVWASWHQPAQSFPIRPPYLLSQEVQEDAQPWFSGQQPPSFVAGVPPLRNPWVAEPEHFDFDKSHAWRALSPLPPSGVNPPPPAPESTGGGGRLWPPMAMERAIRKEEARVEEVHNEQINVAAEKALDKLKVDKKRGDRSQSDDDDDDDALILLS